MNDSSDMFKKWIQNKPQYENVDTLVKTECFVCNGVWEGDQIPWSVLVMAETCEDCKEIVKKNARKNAFDNDPPRGIPIRQRNAEPKDLIPELRNIRFIEGQGAYIWGLPGRGKSFQAAALTKRAWDVLTIRNGFPPRNIWWRTDILLNRMRSMQLNKEYGAWYDKLLSCDVLVLDDLGTGRITDWVREQLLLLISERYDMKKCTIITSNYSLRELGEKVNLSDTDITGERVASRVKEVCEVVNIIGEDRRLNINNKEG